MSVKLRSNLILKMRYTYLLLGALFLLSTASYSQSILDEESDSYSKEFIWGVNKNTNGGIIGGFIFKSSRKIREGWYQTYGLEIVNVKHREETRLQTGFGNSFIFGKQNYLYAFRFQYGRERVLFKKASQNGVQINALASGGPTLSLLAPYVIQVGENSTAMTFDEFVASSPGGIPNPGQIVGTGFPLQGLFQSNIRAGLNLKLGLSFEFGAFKSSVTGFEVGFLGEVYPFQEIPLFLFADNNPNAFASAYINFFFGSRK